MRTRNQEINSETLRLPHTNAEKSHFGARFPASIRADTKGERVRPEFFRELVCGMPVQDSRYLGSVFFLNGDVPVSTDRVRSKWRVELPGMLVNLVRKHVTANDYSYALAA